MPFPSASENSSLLSRRSLLFLILAAALALFSVLLIDPAFMSRKIPNYEQVHMTTEIFSVAISFLVFGVGWNVSRQGNGLSTLMVLALGFMGVGVLDLLHVLSYPGLPDLVVKNTTQKSIVLWLLARGMETFTFFSAIAGLRFGWTPKISRWTALTAFVAILAVLGVLGLVFNASFPLMFEAERGLTPVKIGLEWFVIFLNMTGAVTLFTLPKQKVQELLDLNSLIAALAIAGIGEICFTRYRTTGEWFNLIGHIYKMVAYAFIYRAVFVSGIRGPFERIERAQAELIRALRVREDFLMIASHELRTPMTPLSLQIEMIERQLKKVAAGEKSLDSLTEMVDISKRQVRRMGHLIENLLDFARLRSSGSDRARSHFDLVEMVNDVCQRYRSQADLVGSPLQVISESGPAPGGIGDWDRVQVEQLFVNLLSNALKYGAGKPIDIEIQPLPDSVRLVVRDLGVGIAPKDHERIFDRFERAAPSSAYAGLGLGLNIVAEVVRLHHGKISVKSELGKGAEFTVELPRSSE